MPNDSDYFKSLKLKAKGLPVEFYPNSSYEKLRNLYGAASVYWHAAGYGEIKPEHMEHFGITTVEAMAAGAVPIVFDGGGQSEIIVHNKNGLLWSTTEELCNETKRVILNIDLRDSLSKEALKDAKRYSTERFDNAFDALLSDINRPH